MNDEYLFFFLLRDFGLLSVRDLPDHLPPNFALLRFRLPVPYLELIYGIRPDSILSSTSRLSHGPSSSEIPITISL
jgi:hypothetical protein